MPQKTTENFTPTRQISWTKFLAVGVFITIAARAIPDWYFFTMIWKELVSEKLPIPYILFHNLLLLSMGGCLALFNPRQSGFQIGSIRKHWRSVLIVCGLPILLTVLVYPNLPNRPFGENHWTFWAISPLAQDLIFIGFLYGHFEQRFPKPVHPFIPFNMALFITALLFALWHVPNVIVMPLGYVIFQFFYSTIGMLIIGLSRQWTGSFIYFTISHSAVNFIAWITS